MFTLISTRLTLRELKIDDLDNLARLCLNQEITKYMDYIKRNSMEEVEKWLREMIQGNEEAPRKSYNFAIIESETGIMIGWIGIGEPAKEGKGDMDFGYAIHKQFHGKRYGTEALKRLLDFGLSLKGVYEITGECDAKNLASEKVMLGAGMKLVSETYEDNEISKHFSIFSTKRPYIICHMMASIDGKITFGKINGQEVSRQVFDDYFDIYVETESSYHAKAIMFGRVTMEMFATKEPVQFSKTVNAIALKDFFPNKPENIAITIDTQGKLRWSENTILINGLKYNLVVTVTKQTAVDYLAYLQQKQIGYIIAGDDSIDFEKLFRKLRSLLGIEKVILEGGGLTNGSIIKQDLIDEISLLQVPVVINNQDTVSVFENKMAKFEIKEFRLKQVKKLDQDVVWLRYLKK